MKILKPILACILSLGLARAVIAQSPASMPVKPLSPDEELVFKTLTGALADTSRTVKDKTDFAFILLLKNYAQATDALKGFLADSANQTAQIAVAEALARPGGGRAEFADALLTMLTSGDPAVRPSAAKALAACRDAQVLPKLLLLAQDQSREKAVRVAVIGALQNMLDKQTIEALMRLLDDKEPTIRDAAIESLTKLTNIRIYGKDVGQWKKWWETNRNRDSSAWLSELADQLGRANAALEADNARLRDRLTKSITDLYNATPQAQRDVLVLTLLKDPVSEPRLVAMKIIKGRIDSNTELTPELRAQVRSLLADTDVNIRQLAAGAIANFTDPETPPVLLERLKVEDAPAVQASLLAALGQLGDGKGLLAAVPLVDSKYDAVAVAAAKAIRGVVTRQPLQGDERAAVARALMGRWKQASPTTGPGAADSQTLREALLNAMTAMGDTTFNEAFTSALGDTSPVVRLAAVNGLSKLGESASLEGLLGLLDDSDRGVRQAVVAALGKLGTDKHVEGLLQRTVVQNEPDASIRQQAWDSVNAILGRSSDKVVAQVCQNLADRPDAASQRISLMQMLVDKLRQAKSPALVQYQRDLALALVAADRPTEAAALYNDVLKTMGAKDPQTPIVWMELVDCLLAAGDPTVAKLLADQADQEMFDIALKHFHNRLDDLIQQDRHLAVISLVDTMTRQVPARLSKQEKESLAQVLGQSRQLQGQIDQQRVAKLSEQLLVADEQSRKAANVEITQMGERAVGPLMGQLKKNVASTQPSPQMENAIVAMLKQLAPRLDGYDPAAATADKLRVIESWSQLQPTTAPATQP